MFKIIEMNRGKRLAEHAFKLNQNAEQDISNYTEKWLPNLELTLSPTFLHRREVLRTLMI